MMILIGATALLVGGRFWIGWRFGGISGTIVWFSALFDFLAFVVVPIVAQAGGGLPGLPLADPRLGNYAGPLATRVAGIVVIGQAALLIAAALVLKRLHGKYSGVRSATALPSVLGPGVPQTIFVTAWAIRGAGFSMLPVPTSTLAITIALVGLSVVSARRLDWRILTLLLVSEAAWAALTASKTPLMALLLALIIRAGRSFTFRQALAAIGVVVATFIVVQPLKGITTQDDLAAKGGGTGRAEIVATGLGILERFDGWFRITDATSGFPDGGWLSTEDYFEELVPIHNDSASEASSIGQRWTREVRTRSVPYQSQDVPLAFGPTAEGFAVAGYFGAFLFSLIFGLLAPVIALGMLSRSHLVLGFSAYFVFSSVLFERSILALVSGVSTGVQCALIIFLASVVVPRLLIPMARKPSQSVRGV